jgi:hypothetical protein
MVDGEHVDLLHLLMEMEHIVGAFTNNKKTSEYF